VRQKAGVVGGGISGLACAYYLQKSGVEAVVFDPTPGGLIGTTHIDGCILENGPESWLGTKPWAENLIRELGLGDQICGSNDARRRTYVLRGGRFTTLPEGLQMVVPTRVMPVLATQLFGWGTKLRMATEIFHNPKVWPDRSVSEFVADHFGSEAVEYLAEPLLAGVYGGSPDSLSAVSVLPKFVEYEQRFGSVVAGALREKRRPAGVSVFKSLRNGMGSMIDALREKTTVIPVRVESIRHPLNPGEEWGVFAGGEWHEFDRIVLCCGANGAAPLIGAVDARAAELLAAIPYTGSSIWTFGYQRDQIAHPLDAFGFLVPKRERQTIMACTWVATKWLGRVPDGIAVLRCFATDPNASEEAMRADLRRLMGVTAQPIFALCNRWPETMPQYTVGHTARVAEIEARVAAIPGLYLAGNAYHGIGVPDCVRSAKQAASRIAV
jgi:oxygen-dependent protoporphyrinogen oxidase